MSPRLVDDELWELIAPLLPRERRRYRPRPRATRRPQGAERDPVRAHHRNRLATAAECAVVAERVLDDRAVERYRDAAMQDLLLRCS